ncbi:MAG: outer membrane beta-barrel protein [Marinoscillum sp.]
MRIFVASVLLICVGTLNAQVKGYVGLRGGGHFSSAYIDHTFYRTQLREGFIPGYHGGVMVKLFTNQSPTSFLNAGLQSGLLYESKGWRQTFDTDEPNYRVRMDYLNFPLDAIIYAGKRKTKVFATLGIYLEKLISVDKTPDPDLNNLGGQEFYTYEASRDRDFGYGVRASLGVQYDSPIGLFHVDGFLGFSVSSFIRIEDLSERLPDLSNHYVGGFTVAYLIPFGKMEF